MQNVTFGANITQQITQRHHPDCEAWWWQHHVMGMLLISRDWGTCQDRRENGWSKIQKNQRGKPAALCKKAEIGMEVHLSAWQRPELHSQSDTGVVKEDKDKCPWVAQSDAWSKSNRKICGMTWRLLSLNAPLYWALIWLSFNSFMQKNGQILPNQSVQSCWRPISTDSQL